MIRVVIENFLLFLLPTVLYLAYALLTRQDDASATTVIARAPVVTLSILGASLVAMVLSIYGSIGDGKPGQTYEPATYKDGKLIPGRMR